MFAKRDKNIGIFLIYYNYKKVYMFSIVRYILVNNHIFKLYTFSSWPYFLIMKKISFLHISTVNYFKYLVLCKFKMLLYKLIKSLFHFPHLCTLKPFYCLWLWWNFMRSFSKMRLSSCKRKNSLIHQ